MAFGNVNSCGKQWPQSSFKMRKYWLMLLCLQGCLAQPDTPEHTCEVYMTCIQAQKWTLAEQLLADPPSYLQLSALLTKNYTLKSFQVDQVEYGRDSTATRVTGTAYYRDNTYLERVFVLYRLHNQWKIKSI